MHRVAPERRADVALGDLHVHRQGARSEHGGEDERLLIAEAAVIEARPRDPLADDRRGAHDPSSTIASGCHVALVT